jgi:diphthamide biosynthesis protein 3
MAENIYDEIEIEDMTYDSTREIYHYPCPCGDRFEIGIAELRDGEEIAVCPSCSLMIKVIFEVVCYPSISDTPYHLKNCCSKGRIVILKHRSKCAIIDSTKTSDKLANRNTQQDDLPKAESEEQTTPENAAQIALVA